MKKGDFDFSFSSLNFITVELVLTGMKKGDFDFSFSLLNLIIVELVLTGSCDFYNTIHINIDYLC